MAEFELEQYRSLRSEITRSMEDGNQIMGFGLAAIGLIVNAGMTARDSIFGFLVFSSLLPVLSVLVLSMWFAAQERTARASYFLTGSEKRIKAAANAVEVTSWEAWLRQSAGDRNTQHFWSTERAAFGLFTVIVIFSVGFSLAAGGDDTAFRVKLAALSASALVLVASAVSLVQRYQMWKRWLTSSVDEN